jgi:hypothetical protein
MDAQPPPPTQSADAAAPANTHELSELASNFKGRIIKRNSVVSVEEAFSKLALHPIFLSVIPLVTRMPPALCLAARIQNVSLEHVEEKIGVLHALYLITCLIYDTHDDEFAAILTAELRAIAVFKLYSEIYTTVSLSKRASALLSWNCFSLDKMTALLDEIARDESLETNHLLRFAYSALKFLDETAQERVFSIVERTLPPAHTVNYDTVTASYIQLWTTQSAELKKSVLKSHLAKNVSESTSASSLDMHIFTEAETTSLQKHCASLECKYTDPALLYLYVWNFEKIARWQNKVVDALAQADKK